MSELTSSLHNMSVQNRESNYVCRIGFLLLDNFTMIALASAVEPLRMANQLSAKNLYDWYTVTESGGPVPASDGIRVTPDCSIATVPELDTLIVVGGVNITRSYTRKQLTWVQSLSRRHVLLGGICTGPYLLAVAGLLDGYECSAHWECIASLQEACPKVQCTTLLFSIDRDRMTCSGGAVPLDMMLFMIKRDFGYQLAASISEMFICDRVRNESDSQRVPLRYVLGTAQPKLVEAITLMEANIEEMIELDELACYVGLSRRQLERLFQKYLQCSPSKYYLKLRLFRARQLLKQTSMSIIEIAMACGFVSSSHFSKCYRIHIGIPPREERSSLHHKTSEKPVAMRLNPDVASLSGFAAHHGNLMPSAYPSQSLRALAEAQYEPTYGSVAV